MVSLVHEALKRVRSSAHHSTASRSTSRSISASVETAWTDARTPSGCGRERTTIPSSASRSTVASGSSTSIVTSPDSYSRGAQQTVVGDAVFEPVRERRDPVFDRRDPDRVDRVERLDQPDVGGRGRRSDLEALRTLLEHDPSALGSSTLR